jgi:mRNA interferase RelE/StbE
MKVRLLYTQKAVSDLDALGVLIAKRIITKLRFYSESNNPMKEAKRLHGAFHGLYRFRIGDYRAIFQKDAQGKIVILTVVRIKHRKDVYE